MSKNIIYYGVPGTGKSFTINKSTKKNYKVVTTFHPEYDYFDFVGSYKPVNEDVLEGNKFIGLDSKDALVELDYSLNKNKLNYKFIPGVFLKAYVRAWKNPDKPCYLVIEEINRGNCAAIFGDIFQLLDRDTEGFSEYSIDVNNEIRNFLITEFEGTDYEVKISDLHLLKTETILEDPYGILLLPNNLFLYATMNTSDQSLFPMDSAFKRRWEWEYIPIDYKDQSLSDREIILNGKKYSWLSFLQRINQFIYEITDTEDKCLGPYFVKGKEIDLKEFRSKVIFYLWNEILKNETVHTRLRILPQKVVDGNKVEMSIDYNDLYNEDYHLAYIEEMLEKLGVEQILEVEEETGSDAKSDTDEESEDTEVAAEELDDLDIEDEEAPTDSATTAEKGVVKIADIRGKVDQESGEEDKRQDSD